MRLPVLGGTWVERERKKEGKKLSFFSSISGFRFSSLLFSSLSFLSPSLPSPSLPALTVNSAQHRHVHRRPHPRVEVVVGPAQIRVGHHRAGAQPARQKVLRGLVERGVVGDLRQQHRRGPGHVVPVHEQPLVRLPLLVRVLHVVLVRVVEVGPVARGPVHPGGCPGQVVAVARRVVEADGGALEDHVGGLAQRLVRGAELRVRVVRGALVDEGLGVASGVARGGAVEAQRGGHQLVRVAVVDAAERERRRGEGRDELAREVGGAVVGGDVVGGASVGLAVHVLGAGPVPLVDGEVADLLKEKSFFLF